LTEQSPSKVAAAIWPWREATAGSGEAKTPDRTRVAIEAAVMIAVALLIALVFHKNVLAAIVSALAVVVLIGGLFVPVIYHGFKKAGMWLGRAVGVGMSWLLLVPFFYICFTTGRLFLLVRGKDPLHRKFDPRMQSYWSERNSVTDPDRYKRQY
jgi:hypothetical protein